MIRRVLAILSVLGVSMSALVLGIPSTPLAVAPAAADYPTGEGYWLAASDGGIFTFGDAQFYGSTGAITLNKPIVGLEAYPFLEGYWLVATDGGIFTFGSAPFLGSTGNIKLNQPIVGMASTPTGNGYWLVAADGGIFTFGDAQFFGSTGALKLNRPIVGMTATPSGNGYYLVATDGGIFAFGDAEFLGSEGGTPLNKPIVGMETTRDGKGYYLVASDGGLFTHGNATFRGSRGGAPLNAPIVGMALSRSGNGYQLVATDGGIFNFGDSNFFGSTGDLKLNQPILGMDIRPALAVVADAYGTDPDQSSEWVANGLGDFQLVLNDKGAPQPPAGARILGVEGFDVDQLGTLAFDLEAGTCDAGGPLFRLVADTNGDLTPGGIEEKFFTCTGGPGTKSFNPAAADPSIANAQVLALDLVYGTNGGTVTIDDIEVAGLFLRDFKVVRKA